MLFLIVVCMFTVCIQNFWRFFPSEIVFSILLLLLLLLYNKTLNDWSLGETVSFAFLRNHS